MTYQRVSLILPVYRQAGQIDSLVREFSARLERLPISHEILIVLNGPDDGSAAICERLALEIETVRLISTDRAGWGHAVRLGLEGAQGDLICYTNSARTDPDTLLVMLELAVTLPGIVLKANRKTRDSILRHLGSLIYNLECRSLFDLSNFDVNGTPKIFPASFSPLTELTSDDDLIDVEFLARCRRDGYLVLEVPVVLTKRRGGVSTTNVTSAFRMYAGAMLLARRLRVRPHDPTA